jgi:DNA-3-methyladenine glycosylase
MFGPPGHCYVYLIYGMYSCLNFVCEGEAQAAAVLIRALEPFAGEAQMAKLSDKQPRRLWTSGPGRLCRALSLDRGLDGLRLPGRELWLEEGRLLPAAARGQSPRVGVAYAGAAAKWPWRFFERDNPFVSRP